MCSCKGSWKVFCIPKGFLKLEPYNLAPSQNMHRKFQPDWSCQLETVHCQTTETLYREVKIANCFPLHRINWNFSQTYSRPPTTYPESFSLIGQAVCEEFISIQQDLTPLGGFDSPWQSHQKLAHFAWNNGRLLHPITRAHGYYPPWGSFDAAWGPGEPIIRPTMRRGLISVQFMEIILPCAY